MNSSRLVPLVMFVLGAMTARAQPSFVAPAPVPRVISDESDRQAAYRSRIDEVLTWRASLGKRDDPKTIGLAEIVAKLAMHEDADACSARLIELLQKPSGDMFWMFPITCI